MSFTTGVYCVRLLYDFFLTVGFIIIDYRINLSFTKNESFKLNHGVIS